jgi:DNA-binding Lrp family transcriptional regulator
VTNNRLGGESVKLQSLSSDLLDSKVSALTEQLDHSLPPPNFVVRRPTVRRCDEIDVRILTELQRDGRITFQHLSELVGLSPRPCLERVRRLETAHIVVGYTARVDVGRLISVVNVITHILVRHRAGVRARFERHMRDCREVIECFEVSGTFNYIVRVVCTDLEAYQRLTESWIEDSSLCIERVESNIVLKAVKDASVYPVRICASRTL